MLSIICTIVFCLFLSSDVNVDYDDDDDDDFYRLQQDKFS